MSKFYTYLHCKPDGTPFYVGKGTLSRCYNFKRRSQRHKNVVAKHGRENIQVIVFKKDSEESAFKSEIRLIKMLRDAGFELCNMTDGGEGPSGFHHSEETRIKLAAGSRGNKNAAGNKSGCSRKGTIFSMVHREKLSIAGKSRPSQTYRKKLNADAVKVIRASALATKELVKLYDVTRTSIQKIRSGKVWKKL